MEQILEFINRYWGYSLVGGVTVGALVMFAVTAIKLFASSKGKDTKLIEATELVKDLAKQASNKDAQIITFTDYINTQQREAAARDEYNAKIISTLFKSVTYLAMASKLPTEDKEALIASMNTLNAIAPMSREEIHVAATTEISTANVLSNITEKIASAVTTEENATTVQQVTENIKETINVAQTLFSRYANKGE